MHADSEFPLPRVARARVGPPSLFGPNPSAQQPSLTIQPPLPPPRRESVCSSNSYSNKSESSGSSSYISSDARDRNGSISSVCSNLSEYVNRRGSNDSVFSFTSKDSFIGRQEAGESKEGNNYNNNHNNVFRKRKPRSLRNSFESLQLALAPNTEDGLSLLPSPLSPPPPPPLFSSSFLTSAVKFDPLSVCTLTSQLPYEECQSMGTCADDAECSCCESEDEVSVQQYPHQQQQHHQFYHQPWKEGLGGGGQLGGEEGGYGYLNNEHFSGLLSPISEGSSSSSSLSDYASPLSSPPPSPAELSQQLWQGLLASSSVMSSMEPRRVRRAYKKRTQGCNCEKSKCLKLYCECFAKQAVCGPECNCKGCMNTPAELESREKAIQASLDRSTTAFFRSPETKLEHKGCRCKKSQCRKNYCECFSASRSCTPECRCSDCGNVHGAKLPQLRRLSSGGYEMVAATAEHQKEEEGSSSSSSNSGETLLLESTIFTSSQRPPPPPPFASSQRKGPPPPPPPPSSLSSFTTPQKRSPPPPPPPLSLSSIPNLSSLVVSKYRKDRNRDSLSQDPSMFWPTTPKEGIEEGQEEEEEEEDLQSPFGCAHEWNRGEGLIATWKAIQSPRDFLSEDLEEESKKPSFLCPELDQNSFREEVDRYCPDLLMDALAASPSPH